LKYCTLSVAVSSDIKERVRESDWTLKRSEARMKSKKEAKRAEDWTLKQWESMMKSKKEVKVRRIGR